MQEFLFQHPLDDAMRARVLRELDALERRHRVRVLYACESGSRAWGFPSPDSDYDVRFIYVHEPEWYLRVMPQRDVIEQPISDALDLSGWELRKALRLLHDSNPALSEWLQSPLVYRADPQALRLLRALAPEFRSERKCRWHYLAMARKWPTPICVAIRFSPRSICTRCAPCWRWPGWTPGAACRRCASPSWPPPA